MPDVTYTFTWDVGMENFHVVTLGAVSISRLDGDGDPDSGCLRLHAAFHASGACEIRNTTGLTWEALGAPPGTTVIRAGIAFHVRNLHPFEPPDTVNGLGIDIQTPGGASVFPGVGMPGTNLNQYGSAWGEDGLGSGTLDPLYGASSQPIVIVVRHEYNALNGDLDCHFDTLSIRVTYGDPVTGGGGDPDPTPDPAPTPSVFSDCPCDRTARDIPAGMLAHLQGDGLTLTQCLKVVRTDATVLAITSFDQDLVVDGVTYVSAAGIQASALRQELGGGVDHLDLTGLLAAGFVTDTDLRAGVYDNAALTMYIVVWSDPTLFFTLVRGSIGEVHITEGRYTAEFRSLAQRLQQGIGETYSPSCRVRQLGDARCAPGGLFADGKTLADYQFARTVSAVIDTRRMTFGSDTHPTNYYTYGRVRFTSGPNSGIAREVKKHTLTSGAAVMELQEGFPFTVTIGDAATLEAGCDRTVTTCHDRFANTLNMRAEPYLAGWHRMKRRGKKK